MTESTPRSPGRAAAAPRLRWCVVGRRGDGWSLVDVGADGAVGTALPVGDADLPSAIADRERTRAPRWVWCDTPHVYAPLLGAGVRVARCHDLRLVHQILRHAAAVGAGPAASALRSAAEWNAPPRAAPAPPAATPGAPTLFDDEVAAAPEPGGVPESIDAALAEFERQRAALAAAQPSSGLARLIAAESAGALVAAELTAAGLPWDADEHDRILAAALGPRPPLGVKPERMQQIGADVRRHLDAPDAPLDSPPRLLRVLRAAGIEVASTSRWELREHEHPAIAPLLEYKKLSRLLTANGWTWLDDWVHDGRYRPVYVPGGVVTGRWASSGGGALQIPRMLRPAIRADPGWVLVSADVAQLEPRVLAAMAGDRAMAAAGSGKDLYAGIVESGAVATREEAKYAVLGAMYGATSGEGGRLVPRLRRAFPAAMRLVDDAAERGAAGGTVSTWLGRSSPAPDAEWNAAQAAASLPGASARDEALARRLARERGRFTRNFVVQGTAAEWALCWLAELRTRLAGLDPVPADRAARASGPVFARRPHLAFFLHDEVIVHAPLAQADAVSSAVEESARAAGRLLFGSTPVEFPLDLRASERAEKS
ncbi:bifunctional 3'-5' exonuclease/DNA polymerase [Leucobacter chromiiresistens]|uniref:bifunctional 3'-5' exonuclease/DNA polymerase n=1 Tax=Leucobacter chromiiresistens TaxID=1079994 RepID=UPI000AA1B66F|nr:bifunctional 3'-5' exonuclease/DNA polymerase [Leucobacter chromiiresistens]